MEYPEFEHAKFKCLILRYGTDGYIKSMANGNKYERIYDLSFSSSQHKNRIFFLLRDYGETTTVDHLTNNMLFPI